MSRLAVLLLLRFGKLCVTGRPTPGRWRHGSVLFAVVAVLALWVGTAARFLPAVDYLNFEDAVARAFPAVGAIGKYEASLDAEQQAAILQASGLDDRVQASLGGVYVGHSEGEIDGVFYVDHVIGRTEYITYGCRIDADGAVADVFIMSYREPIGGEVRNRDWLEQFEGMNATSDIRLKRTITNIAGATLSCRGITERVRFLLQLHEQAVAPALADWLAGRESPAAPEPTEKNADETGAWLRRARPVGTQLLGIALPAAGAPDHARLFERAGSLDRQWNAWRADGELARLQAEGRAVLAPATRQIVQRGRELHELTGGVIDPTIRPLLECWWQAARQDRLPTAAELAAGRADLGLHRLEFDAASGAARLPAGMRLDFGALRKGMLLDELAAVAPAGSLLDYGGSSWVSKGRAAELTFPERPGAPRLRLPADRALAISSSHRRGFSIAGQRFSHLIDPRSGRPGDPERGAIVIAPRADLADALASACCLLTPDECVAVLRAADASAFIWDAAGSRALGDWPGWQADS